MAREHECTQENRIGAVEREVGDLNDKVWRGNGKPSIIEQIACMRQTVSALCWLVAVTCGAVIAQIVALIFRSKGAG